MTDHDPANTDQPMDENVPPAPKRHAGRPRKRPDGDAEAATHSEAGGAEELDVALGGASESEQLRSETAEAVQELEVEIRNHGEGQADARNVAAEALRLIRENLERLSPPALERVAKMVRENLLSSDYLDPDFWRGLGMVLQYQANEIAGLVRRRAQGEYTLDPYGMDQELIEIVRPFAAFMYRTWWRVTARGLEHVPADGAALLLANRSGALPWDSAMIATAVLEEHPQPRLVRSLHAGWLASVPVMAPALAAFGQVPALPENAARLLAEGQLVCAYPEGEGGAAKLFWNRYRLAPFDAAGYLRAALRVGAPLIPVAVVGAEEIYPMLGDARPVAKLLGAPFFPLTPLFPWLGPLGLIPLPTKWTIVFDEPIATSGFGATAAEDEATVARLAELVRSRVQGLLDEHAS
jgi:1-acyl-sn-glycerol-3-phosphate acyltransferase